MKKLIGVDATLAERGTRYGTFTGHAKITQNIKRAMQDSPNWEKLDDDQREALEMTAHKIGRKVVFFIFEQRVDEVFITNDANDVVVIVAEHGQA